MGAWGLCVRGLCSWGIQWRPQGGTNQIGLVSPISMIIVTRHLLYVGESPRSSDGRRASRNLCLEKGHDALLSVASHDAVATHSCRRWPQLTVNSGRCRACVIIG